MAVSNSANIYSLMVDPEVAIPGSYSAPQLPTFIQLGVMALQRRLNGETWDEAAVTATGAVRQI